MDYGDMARRWQRAAAAGQRARADLEGTGKALQAHGGVHVLVEMLRSGFESF